MPEAEFVRALSRAILSDEQDVMCASFLAWAERESIVMLAG